MATKKPTNNAPKAQPVNLAARRATKSAKLQPVAEATIAEATIETPVVEPEVEVTEQPSKTVEEAAVAASASAERAFTKTKLIKLNRERCWFLLIKKHKLPLVRPGAGEDAEGVKLTTTDEGSGAALVTYLAPSVEDADARSQFVATKLAQCEFALTEGGLPVEHTEIHGAPYLRVPVTRQPGVEEPAKRRRAPKAQWTVPLVTEGEEQRSGI